VLIGFKGLSERCGLVITLIKLDDVFVSES
jgi:hypothetical protein